MVQENEAWSWGVRPGVDAGHGAPHIAAPDARLSELDAGHLVPMERPQLVVEAVFAGYPEPSSKG